MKHFVSEHFIVTLLVLPALVASLLAICFGNKHEMVLGFVVILIVLVFTLSSVIDADLSQSGIKRGTRLIIAMVCTLVSLLVRKTNKPN
jgi:hypothetical protein